jgi:CubicO group peptidase (beta-lactamase class C family)
MGGGGLYSTAGDYLKFVQMILNRGTEQHGRVLKPETVDLMSRNHIGESARHNAEDRHADTFERRGDSSRVPKTWGLSFMINEETAPTGRSPGASPGRAGKLLLLDRPSQQLGGVYLTQIFPFGDRKALPLISSLSLPFIDH